MKKIQLILMLITLTAMPDMLRAQQLKSVTTTDRNGELAANNEHNAAHIRYHREASVKIMMAPSDEILTGKLYGIDFDQLKPWTIEFYPDRTVQSMMAPEGKSLAGEFKDIKFAVNNINVIAFYDIRPGFFFIKAPTGQKLKGTLLNANFDQTPRESAIFLNNKLQ